MKIHSPLVCLLLMIPQAWAQPTEGILSRDFLLPIVVDGKAVGSVKLAAGSHVNIIQILDDGIMISSGENSPSKVPRGVLTPESLAAATAKDATTATPPPTPANGPVQTSVPQVADSKSPHPDKTLLFGVATQDWISQDERARLIYAGDSNGNRIPDFSHAGYGGGGAKIPDVAVKKRVDPTKADDSAAIQAAVDEVSSLPLQDGFRGAVLLAPGIFHCSNTITISQDGVVLRGSGTKATGSSIEMTGPAHVCVSIKGNARDAKGESSVPITDAYVPCGAFSVTLKDTSSLKPGDHITINRPFSKEWIHFMGMDNLERGGKHQTWMGENAKETLERTIASIDGKRVTLDVPMGDAIDSRFLPSNAASASKVVETKRLSHCGVESLRINSPPPSGDLTAANNTSVTLDDCQDCWIRDLFMQDTLVNVRVATRARRITLKGIDAVHSATVQKGAGYSADFVICGSQTLLDRCTSCGDNSFYVATMDASASLNAVLNCSFTGNGAIQPHMRWSTALLLDGCDLQGGRIEFINRNTAGSGHGWAMGWGVAWNCKAKLLDIQQPPGAINWCIGCIGTLDTKHHASKNDGFASFGTPVLPKSLYLAQLRQRLGEEALKNIGY